MANALDEMEGKLFDLMTDSIKGLIVPVKGKRSNKIGA